MKRTLQSGWFVIRVEAPGQPYAWNRARFTVELHRVKAEFESRESEDEPWEATAPQYVPRVDRDANLDFLRAMRSFLRTAHRGCQEEGLTGSIQLMDGSWTPLAETLSMQMVPASALGESGEA